MRACESVFAIDDLTGFQIMEAIELPLPYGPTILCFFLVLCVV